MLRRLLIGLVLGALVGGLVATGLVLGLHVPVFADTSGAVMAYLAAALSGVLTGLVAGKPIWASGAKIEAGLKAAFGAAIAAGLMFALRRWGPGFEVDLHAFNAGGPGTLSQLPATSLPMVAAVLGGFFELDNTGGGESDGKKGEPAAKKRIAPAKGGARVATDEDDESAGEAKPPPSPSLKRSEEVDAPGARGPLRGDARDHRLERPGSALRAAPRGLGGRGARGVHRPRRRRECSPSRLRVFADAVVRAPRGAEGVALTFDDGPHPTWTPRVLEILARRRARATFFVIGRKVEEHPELARAILDGGHALELHSYAHDRFLSLRGARRVREDLRRAGAALQAVTGARPTLFRPPVGHTNPLIARAAEALGLTIVGWTVSGRDGLASARVADVVARVRRGLHDGAIVALHRRPGARAIASRRVCARCPPCSTPSKPRGSTSCRSPSGSTGPEVPPKASRPS